MGDDLIERGVNCGSGSQQTDEQQQRASTTSRRGGGRVAGPGGRAGRGRGAAAFAARTALIAVQAADDVVEELAEPQLAQLAGVEHVPTAVEIAADPEDLDVIRKLFGSRAQTIINILLAFDAYFRWYYPFKRSIPFRCAMERREERALDNMRRAIDMQEIFERIGPSHKSYLPHGAVYKFSQDILQVGDVWAVGTSPLEAQNAETKRVASAAASGRLTFATSGTMTCPTSRKSEGQPKVVTTKGYTTTMAVSCLRKLLAVGT